MYPVLVRKDSQLPLHTGHTLVTKEDKRISVAFFICFFVYRLLRARLYCFLGFTERTLSFIFFRCFAVDGTHSFSFRRMLLLV